MTVLHRVLADVVEIRCRQFAACLRTGRQLRDEVPSLPLFIDERRPRRSGRR
jgi:hypothetical protein